jgi:hypothetical protein
MKWSVVFHKSHHPDNIVHEVMTVNEDNLVSSFTKHAISRCGVTHTKCRQLGLIWTYLGLDKMQLESLWTYMRTPNKIHQKLLMEFT